ncbi:MAG: proline--tRNA ligase [Calditrichia bacterium]|nr:proline--tRNA ligase [Calditrichia bacterium]
MAERITKRETDYSKWYTDIIIQGKLADYSPVKGCMVIRPTGYALWEKIQKYLDDMFKETGHVNAYFPLFIPESFMEKEAEHVKGFSPECAVVTHGGGAKLEENLYIRPTSETIIWSMYKKWIMSYRDLPILINQWANVVRWEMRTRLFLRTTEFLWQEGHTAHATYEEAEEETLKILEVYRKFAEDYMAIPVLIGKKSESEKFAGAKHTYCIEAMMQDKKALQSGTSHNLGQNFAKAFDIQYIDENEKKQHVWQTSWGVSTRLIGAIIMSHGDDKGLVLPPNIAPVKVVIIPILFEASKKQVLKKAQEIKTALTKKGISVELDDREEHKAGFKFNEWELKGVPVRIEIGPKDIEKNHAVLARRDVHDKKFIKFDNIVVETEKLLEDIQKAMLKTSKSFLNDNTYDAKDYNDFKKLSKLQKGMIRTYFCGDEECEDAIKEETGATTRCHPFSEENKKGKCIRCNKNGTSILFAKAY